MRHGKIRRFRRSSSCELIKQNRVFVTSVNIVSNGIADCTIGAETKTYLMYFHGEIFIFVFPFEQQRRTNRTAERGLTCPTRNTI